MEALGAEGIIGLVLTGLTLLLSFISHYIYIRGKLHKAAAEAINDAELDDKTGKEKLELAVDEVYSLIPTSLRFFIYRRTVRKIVQAAFDAIEAYAKKQVEKKSKKKDNINDGDDNPSKTVVGSDEDPSQETVSAREDEYADSGGEESDGKTINGIISHSGNMFDTFETTIAPLNSSHDYISDNQVTSSIVSSINNNSFVRSTIMENNQTNNVMDNEPVACYEDISAGTEYSKQFINPKTGLHTAVLFSSPINNDAGVETASDGDDFIDALNDDGEEVYENRRNKFLVRLAKSTAQNKLVELVQGDYKIAMSPVAAVTSKINRFVGTIRIYKQCAIFGEIRKRRRAR